MTDTAVAAEETPVEITELEKIEAERVDGVKNPANGTPILMMKALPEQPPAAPAPEPVPIAALPQPDPTEWAAAVAAELAKALRPGKPEKAKKGEKRRAGKKPTVAKNATEGDTGSAGHDQLTELVEAAVTKATKGAKAEIESLRAELAKVKATPIPGGPVMSIATAPKQQAADDRAAKAAQYRAQAETVMDPELAERYRQAARQLEEQPS